MCGKTVESLKKVQIEGVLMNVCFDCSRFGSSVKSIPKSFNRSTYVKRAYVNPDDNIVVKSNAGVLIKQKRESLGIKQEDLAKMLSEKASTIHKIESSGAHIDLTLARKIQRILKINLLSEDKKSDDVVTSSNSDGLTLGDIIKQKMRK